MNRVCRRDDLPFHRLAKHLRESDLWNFTATKQLTQNVARSDTRQLGVVADQNQPCSRVQCNQESIQQFLVDHGHLVQNNGVGGVATKGIETPGLAVITKSSVYR